MKHACACVVLLMLLCGVSHAAGAAAPEISGHVAFLQEKGQDPVAYLAGLFERHKIVVFTEARHDETTQYEFLQRVMRHPTFAARVKAVFTEVGSRSQQDSMDAFLQSRDGNVEPLVRIGQACTFHKAGWANANIYEFWKALWKLNTGLPAQQRVWAFLSDVAWDWKAFRTKTDYLDKMVEVADRDFLMAKLIEDRIRQLDRDCAGDKGRKDRYLVIMNTRHALGRVKSVKTGAWGRNVGYFLEAAFGTDQVSIVLYHQPRQSVIQSEPGSIHLIRDGRWDAAFAANRNKPVGFDLAGSPFGSDPFDYTDYFTASAYQEAVDGLVFWKPLSRYLSRPCSEGFYRDPAFYAEIERRAKAIEEENPFEREVAQYGVEWLVTEFPKIRQQTYPASEVEPQFRKWLR